MLNIAFGQSKYFVDNLSENVKRGLRQKLRRGEWPGKAPEGYTNDLKTHTVIVDPEKSKMIRKLFEMYIRKKELLLSKKIDLDEKISRIHKQGHDSLEPMRDFILSSNKAKKIADHGDLLEIRAFLKIVESNCLLTAKKLRIQAKTPYNLLVNLPENLSWLPRLEEVRTALAV